nr:MAG TPA: hypothetical protein [Caudoviricetes sp.]
MKLKLSFIMQRREKVKTMLYMINYLITLIE